MHHYGIIGYPLEHSLSAKLFNEKFAAEGIEAEYDLYSVPDGKWSSVIGDLLDTLDDFHFGVECFAEFVVEPVHARQRG